MTKFEDTKIWVFPSNGATKSQIFSPLKLGTWTFQNKKNMKKKFDKIWGYQNEEIPQTRTQKFKL